MFFLVFYSCSRSVSIPPGSHITFWPEKFLKDAYDWTQEVINTAREHLMFILDIVHGPRGVVSGT